MGAFKTVKRVSRYALLVRLKSAPKR
ncbi:hypothetical protein LCGC14_1726250, partial [marine sediment metagenome]